MQENLVKFIEWTKLKIRIHVSDSPKLYFSEREIWWASLGVNIGYEQDGKNEKFERPVFILKVFNRDIFWALPITSKEKTGKYYYQFAYNENKYSIILSQIRLISSKRLLRKIGVLPEIDFEKVRQLTNPKNLMPKERLNIVDEDDNIIGIENRETIHKKGLLHREVHIHFATPENEIIFQHRAKNKDTFPNLLDATVGGHVDIGNSYEETAIKEAFEETGFKINQKDLITIGKIYKTSKDEVTGMINHVFQKEFIYIYKGNIENLKIEKGQSLGFESWAIERLMNLNENEKLKFIPYMHKFTTTILIDFIKKLKIANK